MADHAVNQNESFEYTYSASQQDEIEMIRSKYIPKKESKLEQLRKLDREAERPGKWISISVGIIGALILGIGMSCTLVWADKLFVWGIIIGIPGIVMVSLAYPLYKKITQKQREKIADQIFALSDELSLQKWS